MTDPVQPAEQLLAGKAYFAGLGLDVQHFAALWHVLKIAQLMQTDLNDLSSRYGISIADFHLLGALMIRSPQALRATDLAFALNVTNAALSSRIRKLADQQLLTWSVDARDRRTKLLRLTEQGCEKVVTVGRDLETFGRFARHFRALPADDQAHLDRIAADLHTRLARDFNPVPRHDT